uniref:Uncharacterized protein n=1 Tax=Rhizophora mucronata TaxID=61149 RepID=A0A2P2J5D2_RHIMU
MQVDFGFLCVVFLPITITILSDVLTNHILECDNVYDNLTSPPL